MADDLMEGGWRREGKAKPETPAICQLCQHPDLYGTLDMTIAPTCQTCYDEIWKHGKPKGIGHMPASGDLVKGKVASVDDSAFFG